MRIIHALYYRMRPVYHDNQSFLHLYSAQISFSNEHYNNDKNEIQCNKFCMKNKFYMKMIEKRSNH